MRDSIVVRVPAKQSIIPISKDLELQVTPAYGADHSGGHHHHHSRRHSHHHRHRRHHRHGHHIAVSGDSSHRHRHHHHHHHHRRPKYIVVSEEVDGVGADDLQAANAQLRDLQDKYDELQARLEDTERRSMSASGNRDLMRRIKVLEKRLAAARRSQADMNAAAAAGGSYSYSLGESLSGAGGSSYDYIRHVPPPSGKRARRASDSGSDSLCVVSIVHSDASSLDELYSLGEDAAAPALAASRRKASASSSASSSISSSSSSALKSSSSSGGGGDNGGGDSGEVYQTDNVPFTMPVATRRRKRRSSGKSKSKSKSAAAAAAVLSDGSGGDRAGAPSGAAQAREPSSEDSSFVRYLQRRGDPESSGTGVPEFAQNPSDVPSEYRTDNISFDYKASGSGSGSDGSGSGKRASGKRASGKRANEGKQTSGSKRRKQ